MKDIINILHVEDDKLVAASVSKTLARYNQNIYTCYDGKEALDIIEKHQIDIIITDIQIPKLDGLELVKILREKELDTHIIITTAFNDTNYFKKAIDLNVEKFIEKPIDIKKLVDVISKITQRIEIQRDLEQKKLQIEHFKEAMSKSNLIINTLSDGTITNISFDSFSQLSNELSNNKLEKISLLIDRKDLEEIHKIVNSYNVYNKTININFLNIIYVVNLTAFALEIEENQVNEISFLFKDITLLIKEKEEIINYLYSDPITKLQNSHSLSKRINNSDKNNSLIAIDIDNFGRYIKMYGYETGDKIIKEVALKLKDFVYLNNKENCFLFKLDSNKFAILIESKIKLEANYLKVFSSNLLDFLENSIFLIEDVLNLNISFTLGGTSYHEVDIISEALMAVDTAKSKKINFFYSSNIINERKLFQKNIELENTIKNAFLTDDIITYFQPIVDKNKKVVNYEALARIYDREKEKVLTPYFFLENIQNSKNYVKFTQTIIQKAIEADSLLEKEISINLSYADIVNPVIIDYLEKILKENKSIITIELLESEGLIDIQDTLNFCNLMKSYGAKIAIDDFGSGYSNYGYFLSLPIDKVKLDGSLVKKVGEYKGFILIESIINFCKKCDIKVVAEFVEDEKTFKILQRLGVDYFQGYYFSEPKPLDVILKELI